MTRPTSLGPMGRSRTESVTSHRGSVPGMPDRSSRSSPSGFVVVGRRWKYAPPPWVMYDALVEDRARWLTLLTDEPAPEVVTADQPDAVVLKPWVDAAITAVEVRIKADGRGGSVLTVLCYADQPELAADTRRRVRHRLGTLLGADLREWVDEPHC